MSVHKLQKRDPGTFTTFSKEALALKGETFRLYCFLVDMKAGADIKPAALAKVAGVGIATVMKAFRTMKEAGFMAFEEHNGKIERTIDDNGIIRRKTSYEFYETTAQNPFRNETRSGTKPVQERNPFRNETRSETEQETRSETEQETRSETEQVTYIVTRDQDALSKQSRQSSRQARSRRDDEPRPSSRREEIRQATAAIPDAVLSPLADTLNDQADADDLRYVLHKYNPELPELIKAVAAIGQNADIASRTALLKSDSAWILGGAHALFKASCCATQRASPGNGKPSNVQRTMAVLAELQHRYDRGEPNS